MKIMNTCVMVLQYLKYNNDNHIILLLIIMMTMTMTMTTMLMKIIIRMAQSMDDTSLVTINHIFFD